MPVEELVQQAFALFNGSAFGAGLLIYFAYFNFGFITSAILDLLRW